MATDWVKMRTDLYRDPKVCLMAEIMLNADGPFVQSLRDHHVIDRDQSRDQSRDHGVIRMMLRCITRNAIVGALVSVWGVLRHRGDRIEDDLHLPNMAISVIDDIAELPGLGKAMVEVGWIRLDGVTVILPKFYAVFNADPATERKAKNAENNRRYRERLRDQSRDHDRDQSRDQRDQSRDHHAGSKRDPREEKRREEKKTKTPPPPVPGEGPKTDGATVPPASPPLPPPPPLAPPSPPAKRKTATADPNFDPLTVDLPFRSERFRETWKSWIEYRKARKPALTEISVKQQLKDFIAWGEEAAIAAIGESIRNGWQGVFPPKAGSTMPSSGGYQSKVERDNEIWINNAQSCLE